MTKRESPAQTFPYSGFGANRVETLKAPDSQSSPPSPEVLIDDDMVLLHHAQVRAIADCLVAVDAVEAHVIWTMQPMFLLASSVPELAAGHSFVL